MNGNCRLRIAARWLLWTATTLTVGCQTIRPPDPPIEDISQIQQERSEEVVREFGQRRDFAEYQAALSCWHQHDTPGCMERLQSLLDRNPRHRDARLLMAELHLMDQQYEEAQAQVRQVLDVHPDDAEAQHTMGYLLDSSGQSTAALAHYQEAAELAPDNEMYRVSYETARGVVDRAESAGPADHAEPSSVPHPILTLADADADFSTAEGLLAKGVDAIAAGNTDEALAYFREAASVEPDNPHIPISAAVSALRHNQPDVAVELLGTSIKVFPKSATMHRTLGTAHYRRGDYRAAQVSLQQALSLDKSGALSYLLMGCTLVKLNQFQAAETNFRQARRIDPRYTVRR